MPTTLLPPTTQIHLYPPYREIDPILYSVEHGLVGLGAGFFSACVKNAYFTNTTSPWGVFTVHGATIPIYGMSSIDFIIVLMEGAALGTYALSKAMLTNFREKNDAWNEFTGGVSGAFIWSVFRTPPPAPPRCITL